jgi:hypothetical protein
MESDVNNDESESATETTDVTPENVSSLLTNKRIHVAYCSDENGASDSTENVEQPSIEKSMLAGGQPNYEKLARLYEKYCMQSNEIDRFVLSIHFAMFTKACKLE